MFPKRDARIDAIADLEIFAGLDRRQLAKIASLSTQVTLPEGSVLCRRGERGREAFVLVEGSVAVCVEDQALAVLRPGAVFGEMSLLDGKPRVATVTATSQVSVLVISPLELASLLEAVPAVRSRIFSTLGARKKDLTAAA
ncbi:cyclic nucleotide-binding domain-containing protein [Sporichthya polymorpha]|uniref:cyclic nucleotide-binding domain-containing protein n=1 Tax=Sporichthya polymorpha TaxID=35751 RepID=UPI0003799B37|nr:cyclic nucleotide-binding domain-containing protein [Sporichthya polymorpha]